MSISTLVIGIGGTGVLALRALKKLYAEMAPETGKPDQRVPMALLAFDFDRSALEAGDDDDRFLPLDEKEFVYLNPSHIQELLRNLDRGQDGELAWRKVLDWFPDREHTPIPTSEVEANGASQLRALGRLGFFLNDDLIETTIRRRLCDIQAEVDTTRLSQEKRVVLVSSMAGGTGAGMLIDMAYIIRRQEGRPRVFAYLLLPEVFQSVDSGGRIFQNTYATLKELAYLKDQQIPFQADYYDIPPVHVAAGGEEPFARLFLCPGSACAGAGIIKESCLSIAETILPQLQRKIQEKTLAVVSNTLSSNAENEKLRRRTHCFSSAGSVYIDLVPIESVREKVFERVVELAVKPELRQQYFKEDVAESLKESQERLVEGSNVSVLLAEPEKDRASRPIEGEPVDKEARTLANLWEREVQTEAKKGSEEIIAALKKRLEGAEKDARSGKQESIQTAAREIAGLQKLLSSRFTRAEYPNNLENLKEYEEFKSVDERLRRMSKNTVGQFGATVGNAVRAQAFFENLKKFSIRFQEVYSKQAQEAQAKQVDRLQKKEGLSKLSRWFRYGSPYLDAAQHVFSSCKDLRGVLEDGALRVSLEDILTARAFGVLNEEVERASTQTKERLQDPLSVWNELPDRRHEGKRATELPSDLQQVVKDVVRDRLEIILEEARREVKPSEDPLIRQKKLFAVVQRHVDQDPRLRKVRYMIPGDAEDQILSALVRARRQVFERRTPNPQRKGFGLLMIPEGIFWPRSERDAFRSFLTATASQVLDCRCQVEDYDDSKIWIYFEDLFNPPEHIHNLDEYHRSYHTQEYPELFHIDHRMLTYKNFRDINNMTSVSVSTCGNPGCRENISSLSRKTRLCPACLLPIRSRCGNEHCTENALNMLPKGKDKSCPSCGEFNNAAWWRCSKHGKVAVEIPIDKERCPRCIEAHLNDKIGYPSSEISVRPDLLTSEPCPRCADLAEQNPDHPVFLMREDLLRYYYNGVNGHDREDFLRMADRYKLPDKFRCPNCRTHLIPVHHDKGTPGYRRRTETWTM